MYEEIFTHGTEHFAGLAISEQWHEQRYPVIRLNLTGLCDPNTLNAELMARWSAACVQAGLSELAALAPHCDEISTLIFKCSALLSQSQTRVVVLIADSDYPLTATLHQRKTLLANQELMRELFLQLSDMSQVHFMLLTGNLHYRIMEGNWGSPIANLSQHREWAQLLGYTQQELETYFAPYLTEAAARLELSLTELLTQLKRHYGGYCFNYYDPSAQVYCPWSLNHFLAQMLEPDKVPEFGTYWLQQTQLKPKLQALAQAFEPELQDLIQRQPGYFVSRYILSAEAQYIKLWQALNLGLISIKQMPEEDNSYGCPNLEMERSLQRIFELA